MFLPWDNRCPQTIHERLGDLLPIFPHRGICRSWCYNRRGPHCLLLQFNTKEEKDITKISKYYKRVTFYGRIVFALAIIGGPAFLIVYNNYIYPGLGYYFGIGLLIYYSLALFIILIVFCCTCGSNLSFKSRTLFNKPKLLLLNCYQDLLGIYC